MDPSQLNTNWSWVFQYNVLSFFLNELSQAEQIWVGWLVFDTISSTQDFWIPPWETIYDNLLSFMPRISNVDVKLYASPDVNVKQNLTFLVFWMGLHSNHLHRLWNERKV